MQAMEVLGRLQHDTIAAKRGTGSQILIPSLLISWLLILVIHTKSFHNHNLPRIWDD